MLRELHVTDLGIVDDATILLDEGMTAITGETGAGKTLLVEALELLVGERATATLVRRGAAEARVEGRFVDAAGGEVVLARVVPEDGRSRAYVNGQLATVAELSEVGATLVDLHGQHSHQSLLAPSVQRAALDRFAGRAALDALEALRVARADAKRLDAELAALGGDARARAREIDLLRFQIDEIGDAAISDTGEDVTLEAEETLLGDAAAHREALTAAYTALDTDALDAVGVAVGALTNRLPFVALLERLRVVQAELADLERELRLSVEGVTDDPQQLGNVRARRRLLRELIRKYGDTLADVLTYAQTSRERLQELEGYEARAAELEGERSAVQERIDAAARALSDERRQAAPALAAAVTVHLDELAMPSARVEVVVESGTLTDDGADDVTYLLAANPGEPARPLARAASGGELARAMLALRLVLTEAPPTLVFDEVDAGIGGEAGNAVGRLLGDLGARHQVLCVTHLAQVAAHADAQIVVEKHVQDESGEESGRTVASVTPVAGDLRLAELSRMLAGVVESSHARSHAAELLQRAADRRAADRRATEAAH
jgi:DNA repair protein RecN (Recombination protein N)